MRGPHVNQPAKVLLDANVLFKASIRDFLLRCAARGLIRIFWSAHILAELAGALQKFVGLTPDQTGRLVAALEQAFPEAMVHGFEELIPAMKNHPSDRHVAAAAMHCGADILLTDNLRDFKRLKRGLRVINLQAYFPQLAAEFPEDTGKILVEQVAALEDPPIGVGQLMDIINVHAPGKKTLFPPDLPIAADGLRAGED